MSNPNRLKESFTSFLQWALPQMRMRWRGFRKVQNQVIKRIRKRLGELEIDDLEEYKDHLRVHPCEWIVLDQLCQITISRFYRDRGVQDNIRLLALPSLAKECHSKKRRLRIWSVGSAGGEEPYTISLMLHFNILSRFPGLNYSIECLEINPELTRRAKRGCYTRSSLKEIPGEWLMQAFEITENVYCIKDQFKSNVFFHQGDIRKQKFSCEFDLVFCRYLIAIYFDQDLQINLFGRMIDRIRSGGYLILGSNEELPQEVDGMHFISKGIYRKSD